jgi:hypothetical protein
MFKPKYKYNKQAFKEINPESAYWLGVLFADGYINWKTFSSPQTILDMKDLDHLEKFRDFLLSDFRILKQTCRTWVKKDGTHPISYRININSKEIAEDIKKYGFEREKPIKELELNPDFWRGVIDGDGSIFLSKSKNSKYVSMRLSLVGSKNILKSFQKFIWSFCPEVKASIYKHKSIFEIKLSSKSARKVINALYHQNMKYYLTRKRDIILKYYNDNPRFRDKF